MSGHDDAEFEVLYEFDEALASTIHWSRPRPALIVVAEDASESAAVLPTLQTRTTASGWEWRAVDAEALAEIGTRELVGGWCQAARERDSGVVLAAPDAHLLPLDLLSGLGSALQRAMSDHWPLVAVLTGDQTLYERILDGPSYLERANWIRLND